MTLKLRIISRPCCVSHQLSSLFFFLIFSTANQRTNNLFHIRVTSCLCDLVMYDPLLCGKGIS